MNSGMSAPVTPCPHLSPTGQDRKEQESTGQRRPTSSLTSERLVSLPSPQQRAREIPTLRVNGVEQPARIVREYRAALEHAAECDKAVRLAQIDAEAAWDICELYREHLGIGPYAPGLREAA